MRFSADSSLGNRPLRQDPSTHARRTTRQPTPPETSRDRPILWNPLFNAPGATLCHLLGHGDTDRFLYVTRRGGKIAANHQFVFHDHWKGAATRTVVSDG